MKLLITAKEKRLDGEMDLRFGRAKFFILLDTDANEVAAYDNAPALSAAQGAGIQAAQNVVNLGAEAVITGNMGPNAFRVLEAAGIKVYLCSPMTVGEAVQKFKMGALKEITAPNVEGHWR